MPWNAHVAPLQNDRQAASLEAFDSAESLWSSGRRDNSMRDSGRLGGVWVWVIKSHVTDAWLD